MTMQEWLQSKFNSNSDGLIVYQDPEKTVVCDATWLSNELGTTIPPTHTGLSSTSIASQGWQPIFDDWQTKGVVS